MFYALCKGYYYNHDVFIDILDTDDLVTEAARYWNLAHLIEQGDIEIENVSLFSLAPFKLKVTPFFTDRKLREVNGADLLFYPVEYDSGGSRNRIVLHVYCGGWYYVFEVHSAIVSASPVFNKDCVTIKMRKCDIYNWATLSLALDIKIPYSSSDGVVKIRNGGLDQKMKDAYVQGTPCTRNQFLSNLILNF